jgi:ElaB/YqjD/DUF883 family membrane-anchored ribosome-binding protein
MSRTIAKSRSSHRAPSISKSAHELNGAAKHVKSTASRAATGGVQTLREKIQDGTKAAVIKAKRIGTAVRAQAVRADKKIRAKPYHSMGIAAGAGLIAGYLLSRKRSSAS